LAKSHLPQKIEKKKKKKKKKKLFLKGNFNSKKKIKNLLKINNP
jgi:hypothetical protein